MPNTDPHTELLHLVTYMITSASGLYHEPPDYGSFRLLDAAARLLALMQSTGELDPFLSQLKTELDAEREGSMDPERQRQNIERWVLELAGELRQRQDS
jgi:hypothetical protein